MVWFRRLEGGVRFASPQRVEPHDKIAWRTEGGWVQFDETRLLSMGWTGSAGPAPARNHARVTDQPAIGAAALAMPARRRLAERTRDTPSLVTKALEGTAKGQPEDRAGQMRQRPHVPAQKRFRHLGKCATAEVRAAGAVGYLVRPRLERMKPAPKANATAFSG